MFETPARQASGPDAIDIERRHPFRCPGMFRSAQRPSKATGPAFPMKITFRMSHDRGAASLPLPTPLSRLTREISEGAQLSKFASPSLAQPSCSPLAHVDPPRVWPSAAQAADRDRQGAQPRSRASQRLLASSDRRHPVVSLEAEGASGRSTGQIRAYLPCAPLQKFSAPTARPQ